MIVEEKKCVTIEKTYHFNIKIDSDNYFIIVETLDVDGKEILVSHKRGNAFWDCKKSLTTSQIKQIQRIIELMF